MIEYVNTAIHPRRLSRWTAGLLAAALVVGGSIVAASPSEAAPDTVVGGSLEWGADAGYRSVFASRTIGAPASLTGDDLVRFPASASSTWDSATQSGTLSFEGSALIGYLAGPPGMSTPGVTQGNYFYLKNPVVTIDGATGTLSGITAGSSHDLLDTLPTAAQANRTIADLDFSGVTPVVDPSGTLITWTGVPATITEAGADVFAHYDSAGDLAPTRRAAGTALDPVTIQLSLVESTSLSLTAPSSATVGADVVLVAEVSPAEAAGTVEFFDGGVSLGSTPVTAGVASLSVALAAGERSVSAVFTPSDTSLYAASTSSSSTVTVGISDAEVVWPFNVYSQDWQLTTSGGVEALPVPEGKLSGGFVLTGGTGGIDATTGAERLSFDGTASYRMYPTLPSAANAVITLSDFTLNLEEGRAGGTLTADVGIGASPSSTSDDVVIARFAISGSKIVATAGGLLAVTDAPAYTGALGAHAPYSGSYTDTWPTGFVDAIKDGAAGFGSPVNTIQSFFYRSGETPAQANKPPLPLTISYGETITPTITTTVLASSSATAIPGADLTLTATVSPAAAGTVEFFEGSTSLGSSAVSGGTAQLAVEDLAMGTHSYRAEFTPYNSLANSASASAAISVVVQIENAEVVWPFNVYSQDWQLTTSGGVEALPVPEGKLSGGFVLTGGVGSLDPEDGSGTLVFDGTASYRMYPTLPSAANAIITLSDLRVELSAGQSSGTLIADVGIGASPSSTAQDVVIASFGISPANKLTTAGGFKAVSDAPAYVGALGGHAPYSGSYTDTWPTGFVDAIKDGAAAFGSPVNTIQSFFYKSSESALQASKPPLPLTISYGETFATASTATSLAVSSVVAPVGGSVLLTATVSPAAGGTVEFFDGASSLGTASVSEGVATLEATGLSEGQHSFSAAFSSANKIAYSDSTSAGVTVDVVQQTTIPSTAPAGSLQWGVKASYRDYITGPIAHGAISVSGDATGSGGVYRFPQSGASGYNPASGTGSTAYRGAVRFSGHDGLLDVTISNPAVNVTGPNTAILSATVSGFGRIDLGVISLSSASKTVVGGAVIYGNAPVTLTAAGVPVFERYAAGESLDPVSFTIGTANASSAPAATTAAYIPPRTPADTPPSTEGLQVDGDVVDGREITASASGFEPNEEGILVVIYSEPTLLGTTNADAGGTATWTGRLPSGLTGEHTLTFQGSVARGVVLDIPATITAAAAEGCPVTDAALTWGFKESFRSYISGSIANGEWTTADGATYSTPDFSWTSGVGAFDMDRTEGLLGFTGSITFTGHGGILNTTVANPQLRFDDADTATLLLDVSGTTQAGDEVSQAGVEFATIDLSAAAKAVDGSNVSFSAAPAVLLEAGAKAFGTYQAGEELDPISVTFTTGAACGEIGAEAPTSSPVSASGADLTWLWWAAGILLLVLLVVAATILTRRTRRS